MGTNYYAIPKVSDELKKKIIDKINLNQLQEAKMLIPSSVHIGKASMGWQFCFNHNNWEHFNKSLESIEEFLNSSKIEDEYGKPVSVEDFWKMVNDSKHLLDNKKYYERWDEYNINFVTNNPLKKPSYIPANFGQEIHFGLFFSDSVEFS
jgi:hypothetical protein